MRNFKEALLIMLAVVPAVFITKDTPNTLVYVYGVIYGLCVWGTADKNTLLNKWMNAPKFWSLTTRIDVLGNAVRAHIHRVLDTSPNFALDDPYIPGKPVTGKLANRPNIKFKIHVETYYEEEANSEGKTAQAGV